VRPLSSLLSVPRTVRIDYGGMRARAFRCFDLLHAGPDRPHPLTPLAPDCPGPTTTPLDAPGDWGQLTPDNAERVTDMRLRALARRRALDLRM
jgi:hypothetical protein